MVTYCSNVKIIESNIEGHTSPNWIIITVIHNNKTTVFTEFHIEQPNQKYQLELYDYYTTTNKDTDSYIYTLIEIVKW